MLVRSVLAVVVALIGFNGTGSHALAAEPAALPKEITGKTGAAGAHPGRPHTPWAFQPATVMADATNIPPCDRDRSLLHRQVQGHQRTISGICEGDQSPRAAKSQNPTRNLWEGSAFLPRSPIAR